MNPLFTVGAYAVLATFFLVYVLARARKHEMTEGFFLAWLGFSVGLLLLLVFRRETYSFAWYIGVENAYTLVLTAVCAFLLLVCVGLTVAVSRMQRMVVHVCQELALLRAGTAGPAAAPEAAEPAAGSR